MNKKFAWILEEAKKDFSEGMNWMNFSNKYFEFGSRYMPQTVEERKEYLESTEFQAVMDLKFELEKQQPDIEKPFEEYSGKYPLRMPRSLHKDLVLLSEKENLSLNQLMIYLLTKSVVQYNQGD